jgi:prefoldin subunit 5
MENIESIHAWAKNEQLQQQLAQQLHRRSLKINDLQESERTREYLKLLQNNTTLKTQINVGADTFMHCRVTDTSKITMKLGANVYLEMDLMECNNYLEKLIEKQNCDIESKSLEIAKVRAEIAMNFSNLKL